MLYWCWCILVNDSQSFESIFYDWKYKCIHSTYMLYKWSRISCTNDFSAYEYLWNNNCHVLLYYLSFVNSILESQIKNTALLQKNLNYKAFYYHYNGDGNIDCVQFKQGTMMTAAWILMAAVQELREGFTLQAACILIIVYGAH